jgi:predicted porin
MKKSLIALAALAAVSAASAQSSVSLYGIADIYVGKAKGVSAAAGDGGLAGSRFGLKGSEDVGGGLKVNFNLESAVNLGNGATDAKMFQRQANVGLSGGFGTVKLGRSFTAYDDIHGAANSGFDSALSATNNVWVGYQSSVNAQIYYATPEVSGLSGAVGLSLKGNQTATPGSTNDITSFNVKYANGPIYAGLAYQNEKAGGISGADRKHTLLNASYDLGVAKLLAAYSSVNNPSEGILVGAKTNEYQFGADMPVSSNLTLSAGYAYSKTKVGALSARNAVGYGLAAGYSLSKRTTVYGGFRANKTDGVKDNLLAMGVNHTF